MLRLIKPVAGYTLEAEDGPLGAVKDFLFDEEHWAVRYLVADTRRWLPGRKVLLSPVSVEKIDWTTRQVDLAMTQEDIEKAPDLDENEPVSRAYERRWHDSYGLSYYWISPGIWGAGMFPKNLMNEGVRPPLQPEERGGSEEDDPVLRSVKEVCGYHIQANDGEVGHVHDFIFDEESWVIRYLVVDTRNWLPGRKVLLAPGWMSAIHWAESNVTTSLSREAVKNAPVFDPARPVNREYEQRLYDYYGRPVYW